MFFQICIIISVPLILVKQRHIIKQLSDFVRGHICDFGNLPFTSHRTGEFYHYISGGNRFHRLIIDFLSFFHIHKFLCIGIVADIKVVFSKFFCIFVGNLGSPCPFALQICLNTQLIVLTHG